MNKMQITLFKSPATYCLKSAQAGQEYRINVTKCRLIIPKVRERERERERERGLKYNLLFHFCSDDYRKSKGEQWAYYDDPDLTTTDCFYPSGFK